MLHRDHFVWLLYNYVDDAWMGCTCNSDRAPKKYAILVRVPLCDYVEGVERDGRVKFRFMKQVRIWTKIDAVQYHVQ
jgi:hypothetical protein